MLEAALAAGITSAGGDVLLGGVLPTPAAPLLLGRYGFDLAAVISASHNPFADNGIKFFGPDGFKLSDADEAAIEALLAEQADAAAGRTAPPAIGRVRQLHGTLEDYLRELQTRFGDLDLAGVDVVLDCAHGATYQAAPEIFRRLGATVTVLADAPDGRNINAGCGSTHLDLLIDDASARAATTSASPSTATATACWPSTATASIVDGDELIALAALSLRERGRLTGGVAVTVMTNYGFHAGMREAGVEVAITSVGDRYVLEELRNRGWSLGGEQSGHIIDMGFVPSGDGIASALLTLEALERRRPGRPRGDGEDPAAAGQRPGRRPRRGDGQRRAGRGDRARERGAGGPRARARAPVGHRAARARDGRGAVPGRDRRDLRPPRRRSCAAPAVDRPTPDRRPTARAAGKPSVLSKHVRRVPRPARHSFSGPHRQEAPPMCGIVGYVGQRPAQEILLAGPAEARVPRL